jgi:glucose/mannose-6-phosphate isomerase
MNLDDLNSYSTIDQENILQNTNELPDQVTQAWSEMKQFVIPTHYMQVTNVCLLGIGGSAMGADLVRTLALSQFKAPVTVVRDYDLPAYVNSKTLVIGVSYSGNTEETLTAFEQAAKRGAKLVAIATGGKLESLASKFKAPFYKISYGAQPRAALGFSFTAQLAIFAKLGFVEVKDVDIDEAIELTRNLQGKIRAEVPENRNIAKQIAHRIQGKIPIVYGSGTLQEVARRFKGQFNENAKSASYFEVLPELNHNALVGTEFPAKLGSTIFVIILQSHYDHPRNKIRQAITMQILQKRSIEYESILIEPPGNPVAEMLQSIMMGDYISYYASLLNGVDPTPVEIITYLKDQLAKQE